MRSCIEPCYITWWISIILAFAGFATYQYFSVKKKALENEHKLKKAELEFRKEQFTKLQENAERKDNEQAKQNDTLLKQTSESLKEISESLKNLKEIVDWHKSENKNK